MANTKKNIAYQTFYQIFSLIIPFITAPYISRILGSDQVGIYSYNYSIVNYFMIAEMLGLEAYGARTIAMARDNREEVDSKFSQLVLSHLLVSGIVISVYFLYCVFVSGSNRTISLIQSLYLVGQMLNISWLFTGLSEHRIIVIRNTVVKVIMCISIFTLVRTENDLLIYIAILAVDMFVSQALLWTFRRKYATLVKADMKDVINHIKPQVVLFVSIIASSIYRMMDKTMIGYLGFLTELGQYEYADKIIQMPLSIVFAIGTVMLSRSAHLFSRGEKDRVFYATKQMLRIVTIFSSLMFFGIQAYGSWFCVLYLGKAYEYSGTLLSVLAITLLFISWNSTLRTQYFIPQSKDKSYVSAVIIGAATNIILNLILIPAYRCVGACIATVFSYGLVSALEIYFARKDLDSFRLVLSNIAPFLLGAIPFTLSFLWKPFFHRDWIGLIVQMVIFCLEFALLLIVYLAATNSLKKAKQMIFGK